MFPWRGGCNRRSRHTSGHTLQWGPHSHLACLCQPQDFCTCCAPAGNSLPQAPSACLHLQSFLFRPCKGPSVSPPQLHTCSLTSAPLRTQERQLQLDPWVPRSPAGCLADTHFGVGQLASGWLLGSQLLGDVPEHSCSQLPAVTGQEGPQHAIHLTCSEKGHLPVIPGPAGSPEEPEPVSASVDHASVNEVEGSLEDSRC